MAHCFRPEKIDDGLADAQDSGDLRFFNREYQKRRIAAKLRGESFPNYGIFRGRLKKVPAGVAAGKVITPSIIGAVFGECAPGHIATGGPETC